MFRPRTLTPRLLKLARQYPLVTLTGPRQSGKTTLCRRAFPAKPYFSLENPDLAYRVKRDPRAFLEGLSEGAILDEVQRIPELFSYLQEMVDENPKPGRFILTGSAQFEMMEKVTQSLAGRTALVTLLPFSLAEAYPRRERVEMAEMLFRGFYPGALTVKRSPHDTMSFYCSTYVERDVRTLLGVRDLGRFQTFLKLAAARTGQILNLTGMGAEAGINHLTAGQWMSVLETSFVTYRLRPHHSNFGKRLIKAPKIYFIDTALAAYLIEISESTQLKNHPLRGHLFESFVVSEILKQRCHSGLPPNLHYFRDNNGVEVDILLDMGSSIVPIEIKSAQTVAGDFFKNLDTYRKLNPAAMGGILVYGGRESYVERDHLILGFRDLPLLTELKPGTSYRNLLSRKSKRYEHG